MPLDKHDVRYMKIARVIAEENKSCLSRKIGVVLVTKENGSVSPGYNGSIRGGPPNDSFSRLGHIHRDLMSDQQREHVRQKYGIEHYVEFAAKFEGCGTCPRRLLDLPSGQGLEICNCAHAERNALANANRSGLSTLGSTMYCYCGVPCHDCAIQAIQAGVSRVVCLKTETPDYSKSSRQLFQEAKVTLDVVDPTEIG